MINLGIVGAGYMARKYLEVIKNSKKFKICCVSSTKIKTASRIAREFRIDKYYDDYKKMIKSNNIDAVIIATSIDQTPYILQYVLYCKIPVLVEKPISLNLNFAKKLSKLALKNNVKNMVALNRRFYSNIQKVKKIINKEKITNILIEGHERFWRVKGNYNKKIESNWLFANSIHTIDLLLYFGGTIKKINILKKKIIHNNGDNYNISIEFKNNCLGSYISNWFVPGGWTIKIYTQKKYFNFINLENCIMQDRSFKKTRINLTKADKNYKPGLKLMIDSFYQYLKNDKKLEGFQSIEDNLNTMKLIDKLHAKE